MPGAGKSTIGKMLAKQLGFEFVDLDILIKEKEGKSHDKIAREKGDAELLRLENLYTLDLDLADTVFSPGGSIVYSSEAMDKLKKETQIIYLELPLEEIKKRLGKKASTRGIIGFKEKGLDGLFSERTPLYESFADHTIFCSGLSDKQILEKIHEIL